MKDALRSLWRDLSELRAKTGQKHLAVLKKLAGEEQWPWAIEQARTLMRGKSLRWRPRRRCDTLSGANYRKPLAPVLPQTLHGLVCGGACWARRFSYDT